MTPTRRTVLKLFAAAPIAASAAPALASQGNWFTADGLAVRGYDPVAYFTMAKPVQGLAEHQLDWDGATWRFSSAENMAMFEASPLAYAPQYGGYCAYAVSKGYTAKIEVDAWTVYEDKLYLNFSKVVRGLWSRDIPGNIAAADANWPGVLT